MRNLRLSAALTSIVAVYGLVSAPVATATEVQQTMIIPGAVCQLSIPTTNTGVRPKATGFRNESTTTGNFVICPLVTPTIRTIDANPLAGGSIVLSSLDGQAHNVSCTAVSGIGKELWKPFEIIYSTKSFAVPASTSEIGGGNWVAVDFGQSSGDSIIGSAWFTITCNLPPQVQILYLQGNYWTEIGG